MRAGLARQADREGLQLPLKGTPAAYFACPEKRWTKRSLVPLRLLQSPLRTHRWASVMENPQVEALQAEKILAQRDAVQTTPAGMPVVQTLTAQAAATPRLAPQARAVQVLAHP